ncbi:MAG: hypothetical protein AAF752_02910, partial [Bacteroidota bacterium]
MRSFLFATLTACSLLLCLDTTHAQSSDLYWTRTDGLYKTQLTGTTVGAVEVVRPFVYRPSLAPTSYVPATNDLIFADTRHLIRATLGGADVEVLAHVDSVTFTLLHVDAVAQKAVALGRPFDAGTSFVYELGFDGAAQVLFEVVGGIRQIQWIPDLDAAVWSSTSSGLYVRARTANTVTQITSDGVNAVRGTGFDWDSDNARLFWASSAGIKSAKADATDQQTVSTGPALAVAVDAGIPYWLRSVSTGQYTVDFEVYRPETSGADSLLFSDTGTIGSGYRYFGVQSGEVVYGAKSLKAYDLAAQTSRLLRGEAFKGVSMGVVDLANDLLVLVQDNGEPVFNHIWAYTILQRDPSAQTESKATPHVHADKLMADDEAGRLLLGTWRQSSGSYTYFSGGGYWTSDFDGRNIEESTFDERVVSVFSGNRTSFVTTAPLTGDHRYTRIASSAGSLNDALFVEDRIAIAVSVLDSVAYESTTGYEGSSVRHTQKRDLRTGAVTPLTNEVTARLVLDERRQVLYLGDFDNIKRYDLKAGSLAAIPVALCSEHAFDIDRQNGQLVYADETGIWVAALDGSNPVRVLDDTHVAALAVSSSPSLWIAGSLGLEGLNTGGTMVTGRAVPASQPFNVAPWSYAGTETVSSVPAE